MTINPINSIASLNEHVRERSENFKKMLETKIVAGLPGPELTNVHKYAPTLGPTVELTQEQKEQVQKAALRYNTGKVDWSLLPTEPLEEIIGVLDFGRKKYAAYNWANGNGLDWVETANSLRRHLYAWLRGEDLDKESGLSHLAHIGCNVIFLLYFWRYREKYNRDTRRKQP